MPCSVPKTSTPRNAASAHRNSILPDPADGHELGWLDQSNRVDDHDCRQHGLGQQAEQRGKMSIVAAAAAAVTSDAICVCPPTARTTAVCEVPPPAGMAPNKAPSEVGGPGSKKLAVGLDRRVPGEAKARPAAIVSVKLINAMPSAPGKSCSDEAEIGKGDRRERLRDQPHGGDAEGIQTDQPGEPDPRAHHDEGSRRMGPEPLHRQAARALPRRRWPK